MCVVIRLSMSLTRLVDAFVSLSKSAAMATSVLSDWFECLSVWIVNIPTIALPVIRAPPQAPRPMPCPERGGVSLEMHEQRRALGPSGIPRFNGQGPWSPPAFAGEICATIRRRPAVPTRGKLKRGTVCAPSLFQDAQERRTFDLSDLLFNFVGFRVFLPPAPEGVFVPYSFRSLSKKER